jgi:hypothetical protein
VLPDPCTCRYADWEDEAREVRKHIIGLRNELLSDTRVDEDEPGGEWGADGDRLLTIREYFVEFGKRDGKTWRVGNVKLSTAESNARQRYRLRGKEKAGTGKRKDPYKYRLSDLRDAFPR